MGRHWKIAVAVLAVLFAISLFNFPALVRSVLRLQRASSTEEHARRNIIQAPISTPTDVREKAQLFWASVTAQATLEPSIVELALSADPVERGKQLINALIAQAPSPAQRTLPADAQLLQFYLLPDGIAIADFSETLGTETPSGILNEQMVVDSITRTLAANLTAVNQLKILIHGQEADTLAGHLDLSGFFPVSAAAAPAGSAAEATAPPVKVQPMANAPPSR